MAAYFLSESDRKALGELFSWWKNTNENTPKVNSHKIEHEEMQAPEVYVAYSPSGGISGRVGLVPGSEICDVYQIDFTDGDPTTPTLVQLSPLSQRVYNLSPASISGADPILIIRDKLGRWIVASAPSSSGGAGEPGTGTATEDEPSGACNLAKLKTSDCIKIRTGLVDYYLEYDGSGWTSSKTFAWSGGSGVFRAEWNSNTGLLDLKLGGTRLMNCGNGCYTGGPLTGHGDQTAGGICGGDVFTVCMECHCCVDPLYTGDGYYCVNVSGTGTATADCEPLYVNDARACLVTICSGRYATYEEAALNCTMPQVTVDCGTVNEVMPWVITNKSGTCTCAPDSGTVTYNSGSGNWESVAFSCPLGDCEETASYDLQCIASVWTYAGLTPTSVTATEIIFDKDFGGGNSYRITFTYA